MDNPSPMAIAAPPPSPPAPPAQAQNIEASVDISFMNMHKPDYPIAELNAEITGTTILIVTVDENGTPLSVEVEKSSRNRNLDRAAKDAAMKWRFNPSTRNGKRVGDRVRVPVEFKL